MTASLPSLPRLPVPDLHQTLRGYLKSLEPFLHEDNARGGPDFATAYKTRQELVEDFERGLGQLCQRRLIGTFQTLTSCDDQDLVASFGMSKS